MQENLYDLAVRFYNNNEYDKAAALAKTLTYQQPLDPKGYKLFAIIKQAMGEYGGALNNYLKAHMIDGQDATTLYCMAQCYYMIGHLHDAISALKLAVKINPAHEKAPKLLKELKKKLS